MEQPFAVRVVVWPTDYRRFDTYALETSIVDLLRKLKGDGAAFSHFTVEVETDD